MNHKLIIENWRKFVNEEYRMGAMGVGDSSEKEALIQRFSSAFTNTERHNRSNINQFLSVILGEKPMYYGVLDDDTGLPPGINPNDKKLKLMINNNPNLKLAYAPHTERGLRSSVVMFFGKPENVNGAISLSRTPLIGKEQYGLEDEFWEFAHPRHLKVTPEWNRQLGVLLGYGEANAEEYAKREEERLMNLHSQWKEQQAEYSDDEGVETVALQEWAKYV